MASIQDRHNPSRKVSVTETGELVVIPRVDGEIVSSVAGLPVNVVSGNINIGTVTTSETEWLPQLGIDKANSTSYYLGYKEIGASNWRIKRINKSSYTIDWASGASNPDTAWTNRVAQSYGNL